MFLQNGLLTILHCFSFASLGTLTTILCSTSAHLCCTIFLHTFSSASTSTCLTTHLQSLTGCGLHSLCCSVLVVSRHTSFFTSRHSSSVTIFSAIRGTLLQTRLFLWTSLTLGTCLHTSWQWLLRSPGRQTHSGLKSPASQGLGGGQ